MKSDQLIKYFESTATEAEREDILDFIRQSDENKELFNQTKEEWKKSQHKVISINALNNWKQLEKRINPQYSFSKNTINLFLSVAASVIVLFGVAFYLLTNTLNNQFISIQTEAGQLTEVYLPDSSKVYLNSSSKLLYSSHFFGLRRNVKLQGEAFFDVRKKKYGSFDVLANDVNVHVTGTKFNVKSYDKENVFVVLEEGRVELCHESKSSLKINLKPGEMVVYDTSVGKFKRNRINVADYTNWKDGILFFENNKLPDLLKVLERRYNVQFSEVNDPVLRELTLTFTIRDERFEKIMQLITAVLPVRVKTNNQIINIYLDKVKYQNIK